MSGALGGFTSLISLQARNVAAQMNRGVG